MSGVWRGKKYVRKDGLLIAADAVEERDACLRASFKMQGRLERLGDKIERAQDPSVKPDELLPADVFLEGMVQRKNAPRIVWQPAQNGAKLWSASVRARIYASIEQAFLAAGRMPGGNSAGYREKLKELKEWAINSPHSAPEFFVQKTSRHFAKGLLEERRADRIGVLMDVEHVSPPRQKDLDTLIGWIGEDLKEDLLRQRGRPVEYQRIMFAAEMANLWCSLTRRKAAKGPHAKFPPVPEGWVDKWV